MTYFRQIEVDAVPGGRIQLASVGDFNGDGRPDIALVNRSEESLSVYINDVSDDGVSFLRRPSQPLLAGSKPMSVTQGDFNHDNRLDLAVANRRNDNVSILLNEGSSRFARKDLDVGQVKPSFITAAQLNDDTGDGTLDDRDDLDLVVVNLESHTITVLKGDGDGDFSFRPYDTSESGQLAYPSSVTTGFVNDDEFPDLIVANQHLDTVGILLNDRQGWFDPAQDYGIGKQGAISLVTVEQGEEDLLAVACANREGETCVDCGVSILEQAGADLRPVKTASFGYVPSVAAVDFDGDGDTDLIVSEAPSSGLGSELTILVQMNGRFHEVVRRVVSGDLNGDGRVSGADIDRMCAGIDLAKPRFDLTADGVVDFDDHRFLVRDILGTSSGDANLDGWFDSSDIVQVFVRGKYETNEFARWEEGDWNCDHRFNSGDMVAGFLAGGYGLPEPQVPPFSISVTAIGDFDGDGFEDDLAAVNSDSLSVLVTETLPETSAPYTLILSADETIEGFDFSIRQEAEAARAAKVHADALAAAVDDTDLVLAFPTRAARAVAALPATPSDALSETAAAVVASRSRERSSTGPRNDMTRPTQPPEDPPPLGRSRLSVSQIPVRQLVWDLPPRDLPGDGQFCDDSRIDGLVDALLIDLETLPATGPALK